MRIAFISALVVLLVANVAATAVVLRSNTATARQKGLQSLVVWLVPLLGAFIVITFHWLDRRTKVLQLNGPSLAGSEVDHALGARHDGHIV